MKKFLLTAIASTLMIGSAHAGFNNWSTEIEEDPFSGGKKVTVVNMTSMRSGAVILCDGATKALTVRVIPGYVYESVLDGFTPTLEFAIDSVSLGLSIDGETGSVGDNLAIAQAELSGDDAAKFIDAFASAKKQVAIKDGMSSGPFLGTAKGTTKAAKALQTCIVE